jgi:multimeric flavodoxin WrbA
MPKKIVFVQGSPRKKGNTRAVAAAAMEAARSRGADVAEIDATQLNFKKPGCTGCQKCQQSEAFVCTIDDELTQAVASLPGYDVIVMATPLYWWSFSAQIKMFIDRMYSLTKFTDSGDVRSAITGRALALMATAGGPLEDNLELLERQWKNPAEVLGCPFFSCLFPFAPWEPGAIAGDPAVLTQAEAFGDVLASFE